MSVVMCGQVRQQWRCWNHPARIVRSLC